MVVVASDSAEEAPCAERQGTQERVEGRDPSETGATRSALEMVVPEDLGRAGFPVEVRLVGVSQDLRSVLERNPRVEALEQRLEKARAGLGPRKIQAFEDVVGGNHGKFVIRNS